jgi:lipopolysaccharide/colanic/teichoic acid biosynthesis glycosyltransferase
MVAHFRRGLPSMASPIAANSRFDQSRKACKPGVTGWAQIRGWRGETDSKEKIRQRVEHDLHYIENWSILLDLYPA